MITISVKQNDNIDWLNLETPGTYVIEARAIFAINIYTVTLEYQTQDASSATSVLDEYATYSSKEIEVQHGSGVTLNNHIETIEGFTFDGWFAGTAGSDAGDPCQVREEFYSERYEL